MLEQLAAPVVFPVSLATAKDWVRETTADSDAVVTFLLKAATARVETVTKRCVVYRPVREWFDRMSQCFELAACPVLGVKAFKYTDQAGAIQTIAAGAYILDKFRAAARITPVYATFFPPARAIVDAVSIQYDVGMLVPVTGIAANGTLTAPGHNKVADDIVQLSTDGVPALGDALPAPFGANIAALTAYYVVNPVGDTFQLATQAGGAAIAATGGAIGAVRVFIGVLPDEMLLAMRLMIDSWFRNRSSVSPSQVWEMPAEGAAEALLAPFIARAF
jgi:uncharacterized phiE125 gp8 family phage protein